MASPSNTFPVESQSATIVPGLISQLAVAAKNREAYLMAKVRDLEDNVLKASKENESCAQLNQTLNQKLQVLEKRYDDIKHSNFKYANQIKHLNSKIEMMNKNLIEKNNDIEILRKDNLEYQGRIKAMSVKKETFDEDPQNRQIESDALRNPRSNSVQNRSASIGPPPGFKEIIQIEDDDDDLKHVTVSKHASKRVKRECEDNLVDSIKKGTQPVIYHQFPIIHSEKVSSYLDTSGSSSIIVKKEKQDERWRSKADMLAEFEKGEEICLNAICAIHRQSIKTTHTSFSAYISRGHGISRINQLAHLLTDGDPQQKMKKTVSELSQSDINDCRRFANMYSAQLFEIYKNKDDPFFP